MYKLLTRLLQRISLFCNEFLYIHVVSFYFCFFIYIFLLINSCKVKTVEVEQQKNGYYLTTKSKYCFVSKSKSNTNLKNVYPCSEGKGAYYCNPVCLSVWFVTIFFLIFLSKYYSQKFYTLFVWACHLRGFIFVTVMRQFPVK